MVKNKIDQRIDAFLAQKPSSVYDNKELSFFWGNCYLRKKEFVLACKYYKESIYACLNNPHSLWYGSGQLNWLVDILILSGKLDLAEEVEAKISMFFEEPQHDTWPVSFYAFSIIRLVQVKSPGFWVDKLLEDPKNRDAINLGKVLEGLVNNDEMGFNTALDELLRVHDRRVKYGALRETPEGFICMDGMAMVFLAQKRGIPVSFESEYIVPNYFSNF